MDRDLTVGILYIIIGYLSGSILYARVFGFLFAHTDITAPSKDKNPGTANAFRYGGMVCGILTLLFDMGKGFFPVFLYFSRAAENLPVSYRTGIYALVIAAPVLGHIFPALHHFKGGKGIATSFGSLLGLFPHIDAAIVLAFFFLFFSLVLCISPHYHRTILTYACSLVTLMALHAEAFLFFGFAGITIAVLTRMFLSREEKEPLTVRILWLR